MELRGNDANTRVAYALGIPRSKVIELKAAPLRDDKDAKKTQSRKLQQNDDDDIVIDDEQEWSDQDSSDDDVQSNQTEDDDDSAAENDPKRIDEDETEVYHQENDRDDSQVRRLEETKDMKIALAAKPAAVHPAVLPPLIHPISLKRVPAVLSVPDADANKKGIHEPKPPRGSGTSSSSMSASNTGTKGNKKTRHKFQFPDTDLLKLVLEEDMMNPMEFSPSASSRSGASHQRRRFSSTAAVTGTMLPLRRKSFTLTKGPIKPSAPASTSAIPPLPVLSPTSPTRFQSRRKSTSTCYSLRSGAKSPSFNKNLVSSLPPLPRAASASRMPANSALMPTNTSSSSSQMLVRVRERKSDGRPEVVISKRPARFLVWNWNDRQVRIPFNIQLGPHQHGVMLRQLRYVKSVMSDFPWAKTHLKDLLAGYTKKDMTKEELYPQLNMLSHQVQQEIGSQVKKQKQIMMKKQRLTMQLSLATSVINEMNVTKYGRRGKPHDTKLYYDPGQPTRLQWFRKNGERSSESLEVDLIEIHCYDMDSKESELSAGIKKAIKKFAQTASLESCLSLITPQRTLDLQLKSSMHREWLMNALCDVISFARQYRAVGARRENAGQQPTHVLRRM